VAGVAGRPRTLTTSPAPNPTAPADATFLPGPVLLLGAPGVGKGTQAQFLVAEYGIPQISTGDLFRSNIAAGTPLGLQAKEVLASGQLVSDELVNQMAWARILADDTARGYILDGFPRTLNQAHFLDAQLAAPALRPNLPVVAISIVVAYDQLLRRITGRRICAACKSIYNIYSNPPKAADKCDLDGAQLTQRPDDTEAVFHDRMKVFEEQTAPVVEHYRALGRFREVNGDQPVEAVTAAIESALLGLRSN
jgi:adenylate kinase